MKDIFHAIEHSDEELLKKLLSLGINVNSNDEFGQTPLHLAIDSAFEDAIYIYDTEKKIVEPDLKLIKLLVENGANPYKKDNNGQSPLDWAIRRKNNEFIRKLELLIKKHSTQQ